jgi:hypothetical protein
VDPRSKLREDTWTRDPRSSCPRLTRDAPRKPTIAILTGGGDCPGLNAVIRAATKAADRLGYDCIGFLRGYEGLVDPVAYMPLTPQNTAGILLHGGTILGSTNKGRLSALASEGERVGIDPELLAQAGDRLRQLGVSGLICLGGDVFGDDRTGGHGDVTREDSTLCESPIP